GSCTLAAKRQAQLSGEILRSEHESDDAWRRGGNRIGVEQTSRTFNREQQAHASASQSLFWLLIVENLFHNLDLLGRLNLRNSQPFKGRPDDVLDVGVHPFVSHGIDAH